MVEKKFIKIEDIRKFYRFLNHENETEIRVIDIATNPAKIVSQEFVHNEGQLPLPKA